MSRPDNVSCDPLFTWT